MKAAIHLYGSFAETGAGHGTDRALLGGLLGMKPDDPRLPTAFDEAKKAGLTYTIDEVKLRDAHPNTAVIEAESADGRKLSMHFRFPISDSTAIGKRQAFLTEISIMTNISETAILFPLNGASTPPVLPSAAKTISHSVKILLPTLKTSCLTAQA